jgi:hypothetical protein
MAINLKKIIAAGQLNPKALEEKAAAKPPLDGVPQEAKVAAKFELSFS